MICAPNFKACAYARPVRSRPEMPVGKPSSFRFVSSIRPDRQAGSIRGPAHRALQTPVNGSGKPAGPAPTITRSRTWRRSMPSLNPRQSAISWFLGFRSTARRGRSRPECRRYRPETARSSPVRRDRDRDRRNEMDGRCASGTPSREACLSSAFEPNRTTSPSSRAISSQPAENEGAHENVTQLRIGLDERRTAVRDRAGSLRQPR